MSQGWSQAQAQAQAKAQGWRQPPQAPPPYPGTSPSPLSSISPMELCRTHQVSILHHPGLPRKATALGLLRDIFYNIRPRPSREGKRVSPCRTKTLCKKCDPSPSTRAPHVLAIMRECVQVSTSCPPRHPQHCPTVRPTKDGRTNPTSIGRKFMTKWHLVLIPALLYK